jgi:hypothetical protein
MSRQELGAEEMMKAVRRDDVSDWPDGLQFIDEIPGRRDGRMHP